MALFVGFDLGIGRTIRHSVREECLKYLLVFKNKEHKPSWADLSPTNNDFIAPEALEVSQ